MGNSVKHENSVPTNFTNFARTVFYVILLLKLQIHEPLSSIGCSWTLQQTGRSTDSTDLILSDTPTSSKAHLDDDDTSKPAPAVDNICRTSAAKHHFFVITVQHLFVEDMGMRCLGCTNIPRNCNVQQCSLVK